MFGNFRLVPFPAAGNFPATLERSVHKDGKMAGFDDAGIFYSDNFATDDQPDEHQIDRVHVKKRFKEFIRQFHEGNFSYRYR